MEPEEVGRRLARRHHQAAAADPVPEVDQTRSLLGYAEVPRVGDWTLRSALVRLAQPNPAGVGALLQVMRRLDAPLHHVARSLRRERAWCDPALGAIGPDPGPTLDRPASDPEPDVRLADLARVVASGYDEAGVADGYHSVDPLRSEERLALPLLVLAVGFADLAKGLATWADAGLEDPPLDRVEHCTSLTLARLDELGVPEEEGPPPRGPRRRG